MTATPLTAADTEALLTRTNPTAAPFPLAETNNGDTIITVGHHNPTDFVNTMLANWQTDGAFAGGYLNDPDAEWDEQALRRHRQQVRHTFAVLTRHAPDALTDLGIGTGGCSCGYFAWLALPAAKDTPGAIPITEFTGGDPASWPLTGPAPEDDERCEIETEYRLQRDRETEATRFTALYFDSGRPGSERDFTTGVISKTVKHLRAITDARPCEVIGMVRALIEDLERPAKRRSLLITAGALENAIRCGECTGTPEQIEGHLAWIKSVRADTGVEWPR